MKEEQPQNFIKKLCKIWRKGLAYQRYLDILLSRFKKGPKMEGRLSKISGFGNDKQYIDSNKDFDEFH